MKSFRKFVAEVAQPKPEEEKRFKDMHTYEVVPHPVAEPSQHTGEIGKPKAKRIADQEGDANYDKTYKDVKKRMVPESVDESEMATKAALSKAGEASKEGKKKVTLKKAPWDKNEELSDKQKKIDHNKNGKIDGHDLAMIRKKKNEEVELDEAQIDKMKFVSKGFSNRKAADRHNDQLVGSGKASQKSYVYKHKDNKFYVADMKEVSESVEQIDEAVKFKKGPLRLKDNSQVMVSKEDADLLTKMFKDLSSRNQREMQKVLMTDKAGFEEIRGFAREAL